MTGSILPLTSIAGRSPWFAATRSMTIAYADHEGRLTPLLFDRPLADDYRVLRAKAGIFDVPEIPLEIRGPDAATFPDSLFTRPLSPLAPDRGRYGLLCHHGGGLACDGVAFRLAEDRFRHVHAARDVFTWMQALSVGFDVEISEPGAGNSEIGNSAEIGVRSKFPAI